MIDPEPTEVAAADGDDDDEYPPRRPSARCPVCGTANAREFAYGLLAGPVDDTWEVGGCVISGESPAYKCRNPRCRAEFGSING